MAGNGNGVFREQLNEDVVKGMRLGRHVLHDPRSRDFQAERAPQIQSVTHNASGLPLNQGIVHRQRAVRGPRFGPELLGRCAARRD